MKQFIARGSRFCLPLVCIVTLSAPSSIRSFLYRQLYPIIPVEAQQLAAGPDALRPLGYREDDPSDLPDFRPLAQSAVRSATSDGQRLRQLGDLIYQWRGRDPRTLSGGREQGLQALLAKMRRGEHGLCGHNTQVLAALWRSLGRDFREVRFTTNDDVAWFAAHYGIEVYSPDARHWMYYDISLNGYPADDRGEPLSLAEFGERLASGSDIGMVASAQHQDWDTATFMSFLREHQLQVFSLNNELRALDADRRFGRLHFAYSVFSRFPHPFDRVLDAVTGDSGPRLTLTKRTPPSGRAALHLIASPVG